MEHLKAVDLKVGF